MAKMGEKIEVKTCKAKTCKAKTNSKWNRRNLAIFRRPWQSQTEKTYSSLTNGHSPVSLPLLYEAKIYIIINW
jgi:hypothetical protein